MSAQLSADGMKRLAENLEAGEVVVYEYEDEDGNNKSGKGVICKSNRGGIRILVPGDRSFPLRIINCYGGNIQKKKGAGSTKYSTTIGSHAVPKPTGETASVEFKDGRGGWTTDYNPQ